MEKITLIAAIICAVTSLTTSLRGLARAREYPDTDLEVLRSSARLPGIIKKQNFSSGHNLFIYRLSTVIWFVLSMIFAAPTYYSFWADKSIPGIMVCIALFITLAVVIFFIWAKTPTSKN